TGAAAALAGAGPDGAVDSVDALGGQPGPSGEPDPQRSGDCRWQLVAGGPVEDAMSAAGLDALVESVREQRPEALLVVAGVADAGAAAAPRLLLASGPGVPAGELTSRTTSQPGLAHTPDLTATLLAAAGADPSATLGQQLRVVPDRAVPAPGDDGAPEPVDPRPSPAVTDRVQDRLQDHRDVTLAAAAVPQLTGPVLTVAAVTVLVLLAGLLAADRRTAAAVAATAAQSVPAATFLASLVPWWRDGAPLSGRVGPTMLALSLVLAGLVLGQLLLAWAGPWRRHPLGPPAVVAAVTVVVLSLDVVLGSRLGLLSVLGLRPTTAGRFHGMGNAGLGILATSVLLLAGFLASRTLARAHGVAAARWAAAAVVLLLGLLAATVDGVPVWGADFGGVPPLLLATGLLAMLVLGLRPTPLRVLLLGLAAVAGAGALMVLDWARGPAARTHLGDFVQAVLDGDAAGIVRGKLEQSAGILRDYPVAWLAVLALAVLAVAVARPDSALGRPLRPLWALPALRATACALLVCWLVGWLVNDSGIAIVGVGVAVAACAVLAVRTRLPVTGGDAPGRPARG
ncbi:hypothetical protein, partial [Ornithinicoccus halotolerans]|uniref:hypothetical protein n=1 Tax=Ornithinicoccus halotolerans TaxID=1748220 RepID=UPI001886323C